MKKYLRIFTTSLLTAICLGGFTSCSDDDEEKEKVFTFAADGTPELIGDSGLDFAEIYQAFAGKILDYSSYIEYKINGDGSLDYVDYYVLTFPHPDKYSPVSPSPDYLVGFPTREFLHYWDEDCVRLYVVEYKASGLWVNYRYLNYPVDKTQESIFFKRFCSERLGNMVKFKDGKLGFVKKKKDDWYFYDGVGVYDKVYQDEIEHRLQNEKYRSPHPSPYDPEL